MADSQGFKIQIGYTNSTVTGSGEYDVGDIVRLTCTPNDHYIFESWKLVKSQTDDIELNDSRVMVSDETLRPHYENDIQIVGTSPTFVYDTSRGGLFDDGQTYFIIASVRRKNIFTINVNSNYGTPYQSAKQVEEGGSVTIRAREYNGVTFSHWSDGSVEVERTIVPTANITLEAIYVVVDTTLSIYQYRAFVKDSLHLNALPKAFLIAKSFTIREDLLSNATSTINVLYTPSNINNGDILVLYTPKGNVLYKGIITQIGTGKIQCEQIQSFYKGEWVAENYSTTSLENEFLSILNKYKNGYLGSSTYQDTLMVAKYGNIIPSATTTTSGQLETFKEQETMNFADLIYSMYNKYGILLDFDIPYGATNGSVKIFKPSYGEIKIADNVQCVTAMTPTTEIEQTNKLVVFGSNGTYRGTYYATTTNGIVKEPITDIGRFNVINTKIVYSDDDLDTIVESNLPTHMYNHYLSFNLLLNNKIYDWYSFRLGMPMKVWNGSDFYDTIYTGYELTKGENQNPTIVKIECGKVRMSLTKKLLAMGVR